MARYLMVGLELEYIRNPNHHSFSIGSLRASARSLFFKKTTKNLFQYPGKQFCGFLKIMWCNWRMSLTISADYP
jgi:hypothetical protein